MINMKEHKTDICANFVNSIEIIWKIEPKYIVITFISMIINSLYPVTSLTIMQFI